MGFSKKEILNIANKEYVVLETLDFNGVKYGFINEIDETNIDTEKYHIIYMNNDKINFLANSGIANILIPLFQKKLLVDLKENNLLGE